MSGTLHTSTGLDFPHNIVELTAIDDISNHDADAPESNDTLNASRFADERVPDGGYGWVVVLSCAILAWWFVGITYSWGVIQGVLVKDGLSSASTLSFVGSLTVACLAIFAIVNARIIHLLGARDTAILGVLFFGVGQILSSFTTHNIAGLFVTTGMTMGIGARRLFRDFRFSVLFVAGAVATFPLFVPPFFLPLYSASLGLSPLVGASLVAGFNLSSAVGRVGCGFVCDRAGPLNTLILALSLSTVSILTLWPSTIAPLIAFVVINGAANGGFFASMPTVLGNVFGLARLSTAMGMIVTGWADGYLMGAPIAGYILDASGGPQAGFEAYRPAVYYAGSMTLASTGLIVFVRLRLETSLLSKL